jgi:hypothetical protein
MVDIVFLLDESSSMAPHAKAYINCINKLLTTQRYVNPNAKFSMIKFSTQVNTLCIDEKINTLPEFTPSHYKPYGMTALYDAIGHVIHRKFTEEFNQVIVIILTDGEDNCSSNSLQDISKKISYVISKGWFFIYIAANQNAQKIGHQLGIETCLTYNETEKSIDHVSDVCSIAIGHAVYRWTGIHNQFSILEIPSDVSDIMEGLENFTI